MDVDTHMLPRLVSPADANAACLSCMPTFEHYIDCARLAAEQSAFIHRLAFCPHFLTAKANVQLSINSSKVCTTALASFAQLHMCCHLWLIHGGVVPAEFEPGCSAFNTGQTQRWEAAANQAYSIMLNTFYGLGTDLGQDYSMQFLVN